MSQSAGLLCVAVMCSLSERSPRRRAFLRISLFRLSAGRLNTRAMPGRKKAALLRGRQIIRLQVGYSACGKGLILATAHPSAGVTADTFYCGPSGGYGPDCCTAALVSAHNPSQPVMSFMQISVNTHPSCTLWWHTSGGLTVTRRNGLEPKFKWLRIMSIFVVQWAQGDFPRNEFHPLLRFFFASC